MKIIRLCWRRGVQLLRQPAKLNIRTLWSLCLCGFITLSLLSACGATGSTAASAPTFGQRAQRGQAIFARICAECHGEKGEGRTAPPNIGPKANLGKYDTARGLLDYISTTMPQSAPSSLSQEEYRDVLSYLLAQNNFVQANDGFDTNKLESVSLKR